MSNLPADAPTGPSQGSQDAKKSTRSRRRSLPIDVACSGGCGCLVLASLAWCGTCWEVAEACRKAGASCVAELDIAQDPHAKTWARDDARRAIEAFFPDRAEKVLAVLGIRR